MRKVSLFYSFIFIVYGTLEAKDANSSSRLIDDYYYLQIDVNKKNKASSKNNFDSSSYYHTHDISTAALIFGLNVILNYKSVIQEVSKYEPPHFKTKLQNDFQYMRMIDAQEQKNKNRYIVK